MSTKELTPEEKAWFESGGEAEMPAGYAPAPAPEEQTSGDGGQGGPADGDTPQSADGGSDGAQPEAGAAAAQQPAPDPAQGQQQPQERHTVPLATYLEEKKARQAHERALQELNAKFAVADDRLRQIYEAQQQRQQPQHADLPQPPDENDVVGRVNWLVDQFVTDKRMTAEQQRQHNEQLQRQQQESEFWNGVTNRYESSLREAVAATDEVNEARQYLIHQRVNELMIHGASQRDAVRQTQMEELQMAAGALRNGANPVGSLIQIARVRGYIPRSMRQGQQTGSAPGQQQTDPAQRLETVARGQEASTTLSAAGSGGNARSGKLTAQAVADMSEKEFKKFLANDEDGEMWRKVMGA